MSLSEMARALGRRGGLRRAGRLSPRRRADIARIGQKARMESLRLADLIRNNFDYVRALDRLNPPEIVRSETTCRHALPRLHGAQVEE